MEYISVKQFVEKFNVSERTARNYCASGQIDGARLVGKSWNVPVDTVLPGRKKKARTSPLLAALQEQKDSKIKGASIIVSRSTSPIIPIILRVAA